MRHVLAAICSFFIVFRPAFIAYSEDAETVDSNTGQFTQYTLEDEAVVAERYNHAFVVRNNAQLYRPLEQIFGDPKWAAFPKADGAERTIEEWSLRAAKAYAAANNSSALIVWRNGRIETEAHFMERAPYDLVDGFTFGKPITALAIGRAIALGHISSLDQPVSDFVHEWRDDDRRSKILIRHLLDMRSGFLAQSFGNGPGHIMSRSFLHPHSEQVIINEYPLTHNPGTRYEFANATSEMVAVVIRRATGRSYREFIDIELFKKIGALGGQVWVNRPGGVAHAGCCILLPPETYLRFAILMLRDGKWDSEQLLPQGFVTEMTTGTQQNPYYGLGVFVSGAYTKRRGWANADIDLPKVLHSEPYLAEDLYLFDGNMNQVIYVVPSLDLVIFRSGFFPPSNKYSEWDNSFLPNVIIRGIQCGNDCPKPQRK